MPERHRQLSKYQFVINLSSLRSNNDANICVNLSIKHCKLDKKQNTDTNNAHKFADRPSLSLYDVCTAIFIVSWKLRQEGTGHLNFTKHNSFIECSMYRQTSRYNRK